MLAPYWSQRLGDLAEVAAQISYLFVSICIYFYLFVFVKFIHVFLQYFCLNLDLFSQVFINRLTVPSWNYKVGFQASARGGVVKCQLGAGRVALSGPATTTLEGGIYCG